MNRIRLSLPRSYWISLSAVSLVFLAAQLYLNPFMTLHFWGGYLERDVYRAETGKYRGRIEESFSAPDRHAAYTLGFLCLIATTLISFPSLNRLALLCLVQYAGFFLLGLFYPFMEPDTYSVLAFLSVGLAMIAGIRERSTIPGTIMEINWMNGWGRA